MDPFILAIDTSCDETAVAVLQGRKVLSNVLASQVELHKKYGGVYPIEAKRAHEEKIDAVIEEALERGWRQLQKMQNTNFTDANVSESTHQNATRSNLNETFTIDLNARKAGLQKMWNLVDIVAVTVGPGLAPALEVGVRKAKEMVLETQIICSAKDYTPSKPKKLVAVNHMEGHLLSCLAQNSHGKGKYESNVLDIDTAPFLSLPNERDLFPILGLLVSGGHTEMIKVKGIGDYEIIGQTLDDAAGECLDKVARMLGLGYPGGAVMEELATQGDPFAIPFPIPMKGKSGRDFSFSGLKTASLYEIRAHQRGGDRQMPIGKEQLMHDVRWGKLENLEREFIVNVCASVQRVVIEAILYRVEQAIVDVKPSWIFLGGGVGANKEFKKSLRQLCATYAVNLGLPYSDKLWGDNAVMIGIAGYFKAIRGEFVEDIEKVERRPRWKLGED